MTREEIFAGVNEIFREVFDDDNLTVGEETTANDIDDWDSLEQINLVLGIEQKFNMKFSMKEVTGMKNVGSMVDILMERAK